MQTPGDSPDGALLLPLDAFRAAVDAFRDESYSASTLPAGRVDGAATPPPHDLICVQEEGIVDGEDDDCSVFSGRWCEGSGAASPPLAALPPLSCAMPSFSFAESVAATRLCAA